MRYIISFVAASVIAAAGSARAEVPKVVTDIPPVHALVSMVMGDLGTPVLLTERGANVHSLQLRPSQAADVASADLIVWIGPEMTPWLDRTLDGLATDTAELRLIDTKGTTLRDFGDVHDDEHDHDSAPAADADSADHEGHEHSGVDPHAWLDPANARIWLDHIASELGRLDPENAPAYVANAKAGQAEIAQTDTAVAAILAPAKDRPIVVFHDAYGYFFAHYGLTLAGTISLGDAAAPGAAQLSRLREIVETAGATCIFPETNHDPKLAAQLAESTGGSLGGALDPSGVEIEPGAGLYSALLTGLATTIAACNPTRP